MILAGIDIGTNTIRLLVADVGPDAFREIYSGRKITRLGQDLERAGRLSRDAEERSITILREFVEEARRRSASSIAAVGTSALRKAANAAEFIREVKQRASVDITVIAGEEEARLTLLGVDRALRGAGRGKNDVPQSALVIDIGGGSTEVILTRPVSEAKALSLPLGAVYLTERFFHTDPPSPDEMVNLRRSIRKELDMHGDVIRRNPAEIFVGTAGTVTTLAAMDLRLLEYDPEKINRFVLSRESLDAIIRKLSVSVLAERRNMAGLEPGREDIILAGAVVAQEIMERCGYSEMLVSDWGLREGIVLDLYRKVTNPHH